MQRQLIKIFKTLIQIIAAVLITPLYLTYIVFGFRSNRDSLFWSYSQFLSLFPGIWATYLRVGFYRMSLTKCHKNCSILFGTIFAQVDTEIGEGVYIGPNCNIGSCRIEDYCTLGSNVHIMSGKNQHYFDALDIPVKDQGGRFEKVTIGEDTWIGNGALIMANVGKKCVIGAGSVVVADVESYSVVAGNPARVIKKRR